MHDYKKSCLDFSLVKVTKMRVDFLQLCEASWHSRAFEKRALRRVFSDWLESKITSKSTRNRFYMCFLLNL